MLKTKIFAVFVVVLLVCFSISVTAEDRCQDINDCPGGQICQYGACVTPVQPNVYSGTCPYTIRYPNGGVRIVYNCDSTPSTPASENPTVPVSNGSITDIPGYVNPAPTNNNIDWSVIAAMLAAQQNNDDKDDEKDSKWTTWGIPIAAAAGGGLIMYLVGKNNPSKKKFETVDTAGKGVKPKNPASETGTEASTTQPVQPPEPPVHVTGTPSGSPPGTDGNPIVIPPSTGTKPVTTLPVQPTPPTPQTTPPIKPTSPPSSSGNIPLSPNPNTETEPPTGPTAPSVPVQPTPPTANPKVSDTPPELPAASASQPGSPASTELPPSLPTTQPVTSADNIPLNPSGNLGLSPTPLPPAKPQDSNPHVSETPLPPPKEDETPPPVETAEVPQGPPAPKTETSPLPATAPTTKLEPTKQPSTPAATPAVEPAPANNPTPEDQSFSSPPENDLDKAFQKRVIGDDNFKDFKPGDKDYFNPENIESRSKCEQSLQELCELRFKDQIKIDVASIQKDIDAIKVSLNAESISREGKDYVRYALDLANPEKLKKELMDSLSKKDSKTSPAKNTLKLLQTKIGKTSESAEDLTGLSCSDIKDMRTAAYCASQENYKGQVLGGISRNGLWSLITGRSKSEASAAYSPTITKLFALIDKYDKIKNDYEKYLHDFEGEGQDSSVDHSPNTYQEKGFGNCFCQWQTEIENDKEAPNNGRWACMINDANQRHNEKNEVYKNKFDKCMPEEKSPPVEDGAEFARPEQPQWMSPATVCDYIKLGRLNPKQVDGKSLRLAMENEKLTDDQIKEMNEKLSDGYDKGCAAVICGEDKEEIKPESMTPAQYEPGIYEKLLEKGWT